MAVTRLAGLVDGALPPDLHVNARNTVFWLDHLKHRADEFEAVSVAVLLREVFRWIAPDAVPSHSAVMEFVEKLQLSDADGGVIEHLLALPEFDTLWQPSMADEAVVLDIERTWFGSPAPEYQHRIKIIRASGLGLDHERWLTERQESLTRIIDSGLIFFLPETRSALEGRAFLNLSLEIAAIKASLESK